jgi:hypothetical protein
MTTYHVPEEWILIKILGGSPHYRVFASWRGGYITGDRWQMNSGIKSVTFEDDCYLFYGASGSVYRCNKNAYGIRSPYNASILGEYINRGSVKIEVLKEMPKNIMEMDWLI